MACSWRLVANDAAAEAAVAAACTAMAVVGTASALAVEAAQALSHADSADCPHSELASTR